MKITPGANASTAGIAQDAPVPAPAQPSIPKLTTADLDAMAQAEKILGSGKIQPQKITAANQQALPEVAPRYAAPSEAAATLAKTAVTKSLDGLMETAKRRAKADKSVAPSRAEVLLDFFAHTTAAQHAMAEGYDPNLENKSPQEIARRQTFANAALAELATQLWQTVPISEAFRVAPRETAALFAPQSDAAAATIDRRVQVSGAAAQVHQMMGIVDQAREAGMKLTGAEGKILLKADSLADRDPEGAFNAIQQTVARADAFLAAPPNPQDMTKEALAALKAELAAQKAKPSPQQMTADGIAHMKVLEAEIAGAPAPSILERYQGAMIGLAIGDALGGPTEFMSREALVAEYGLVTDMVGGGWLDLQPGEYTDDTQMAVAMGQAIVDKQAFNAGAVADNFVGWLNTDPKDVGNLTRQSLELRRTGLDPVAAGEIPWMLSGFENAGNGSVMRSAPVALLTAFSDDATIESTGMASSAVTHADPRCQYGTAAIGKAVSLLMQGKSGPEVVDAVTSWLSDRSPILAESLAATKTMNLAEVRTSGYVVHTVQAAFWALQHATSYVDGIIKVTNLGEDTDTAGATAGILLGARFGVKGIPESWQGKLQNRPLLEGLANDIHGLAKAGEG